MVANITNGGETEYSPGVEEVRTLIGQLAESGYLAMVREHLFPEWTEEELREALAEVKDVDDFQRRFMFRFCQWVERQTFTALTHEGTESMAALRPAVFVSNHRDIVLDAVALQYLRIQSGLRTTRVVIGANLFEMPLMRMMARLNKMRPLKRAGTARERYEAFADLSAWIRRNVEEGESVWIAQRNGRAKDGTDSTEEALVKMLAMSGDRKDVGKALGDLNMVPMSISYEWEPCGIEKARETTLKQLQGGHYTKAPREDTHSIVQGVVQPKGRVHLTIGRPIGRDEIAAAGNNALAAARLLDERIVGGYRLWPNNYIAADMLAGDSRYAGHYSTAQRDRFAAYVEEACHEHTEDGFRENLVDIYANPVERKKALGVQ